MLLVFPGNTNAIVLVHDLRTILCLAKGKPDPGNVLPMAERVLHEIVEYFFNQPVGIHF